ncbi:MAG: signal peptidase I [Polyangiaceae bacterium]|nr:signal peptidase I [Polyangiaceae bacterium]
MSQKLKIALVCGAVIVLLVTARMLFHTWRIPQNGMYPSLPKGSMVLGREFLQGPPTDIQRGDVVVYERERDGKVYDFIWRVVGLPGETIEIRDDVVFINSRPLRQEVVKVEGESDILREHAEQTSYLIALPHTRSGAKDSNHPSIVVPDGSVFLLGDNRHHAFDSRADGPVKLGAIHGRVFQQWVIGQ